MLRATYLGEYATHQPFGLIDPSTTLHPPIAVLDFPGTNSEHPLHMCPDLSG